MLSGFPINLALPDLWQQEAVRHLREGRDVIVDAPTGAGKTRIFELLVEGGAVKGQSVYTVPTRALANDKRLEWAAKGWNVGIATGDVAENVTAPVVVATLETQRERFLRGDGPRLLVIDEYQMIGDAARGLTYELSVALAPVGTQLLLLSGSVGNTRDVAEWMRRLGRSVEVVSTATRPVPLDEMAVESLPRPAPKRVTGFWPRVAAEVLMANLGPLLIFAPHRSSAQKIARQIASHAPTPETLTLTDKQERILGGELVPLLRQRVAYHHSGLSYLQRAGVIEPLAKAGQLRVVVATMGLAAGINFSLRSVLVSETLYFDGKCERQIAPDELLQMFGRAGRRGMDECGHVILTDRSPRLSDASKKQLRRANQIDWPTLLRVMQRAVECGEPPFAAAVRLCETLFSRQKIALGFERSGAPEAAPPAGAGGASAAAGGGQTDTLFGLGPTRREVFNSRGEWEAKNASRQASVPLAQAFIHYKNHLEPALHVFPFVAAAFPVGRVCRISKPSGHWVYGREIPLAIERSPRQFSLTKNIRELTSIAREEVFSYDQLDDRVASRLSAHLCGGRVSGFLQRGEILMLQIDFSRVEHAVYFDSQDVPLVAPEEREVRLSTAANFRLPEQGEQQAARDSAVYAWRKLGLIEPEGSPTRRGRVFSFFQGGEGLAIAAALEDPSYPVEELACHIANLRGGHRFGESKAGSAGGSERLASACIQTYGAAQYEGYLEMGIPTGYGEGVCEVLQEIMQHPGRRRALSEEALGDGDFERAFVEWHSLLRQARNAPDVEWDRWRQFQSACAAEMEKHSQLLPVRDLPPVPAAQISRTPNHTLISA